MSRQLRCPNCGGDHTLVNPGITMLICEYCKTVVYWDDETVLKQGAQSILPEADTRLFMHATGTLSGRGFEVVGHLRYDFGRGTWDEWYLQMDDGGVAWVSEDGRELRLEEAIQPDGPLPQAQGAQIGQSVSLGGVVYTIREVGNATCVGGEGQLPFTLLPGEQYPYADVASLDGTRFATLEYDEGAAAPPTCFAGHVLDHEQLVVHDERPPSTAGSHAGQHIRCPNCDAPMEVAAGREVETRVCDYCGAQNDLTGAAARVMGINPQDYEAGFMFEIGQAADFLETRYEVCGRMLYQDEEGYLAREYLLFNPETGYLWLAEENNHYLLNQPTQQAPMADPFRMIPKQPVKVGDKVYRFYEAGRTRLVYVDGSLPWLASSGEVFYYADLMAPPQLFQVESDGQEVEYFNGEYMTPEQVWAAFKLDPPVPRAYGVHPAQPFSRGAVATMLMVLGGLFAVVNLVLLMWSLTHDGTEVFSARFSESQYSKETLSEPFTVGKGNVMSMEIMAPNLNNSWLSLNVALVNAKDEVVEEMEGDLSYYHGVEGGESWSEGSTSNTTYYKSPAPGTYRLLVKASCGSGNVGPCRGERLGVRVNQGVVLSRYFLTAFIISLLFPLFEIVRKRMFETRRWAEVVEDDDDDDDDYY